ncbi:MAG: hypothetical protein A2W68_11400 [Betaproteobacteria bacterium RIFCSPLOWO2_02_64_14]|nr:MAG: hypothetical protein A2W68_11400 [Betaproteobacteria bacterium RIFCSPLOWO2_02_64_14]
MRRRAEAERGIVEFAEAGARIGDELGCRAHRDRSRHRQHVGDGGDVRDADDVGERAQLSIPNRPQHRRQRLDGVMHAPEHHLDESVGKIPERHVHRFDADRAREDFAGEMRRRAEAERGIVEFAEAGARIGDELGCRAHRDRSRHRQHVGDGGDVRDADDVGERAIRRLLVHEFPDDAAHADHAERVAVGVRPRHQLVPDQPPCPRAVHYDDALPVERAQLRADRAREEVLRRARRGRRDDADGLDGIDGKRRRLPREARDRDQACGGCAQRDPQGVGRSEPQD